MSAREGFRFMAGQTLSVPRSLGALFDIGVVGDLPDGQLLQRFTTGHREAAELAFDALVERHGPMVLRVCRRLLDDPNDAEDAFQATFLVLIRRAGSIRERGSLAAWLHGVALRVASRARVESARRRRIERRALRSEVVSRTTSPERIDLESVIHEELDRLPEKYRSPIVLCYLEGLTHEGAADRLGWPVGTVRGRLARARDLLRSRLTRRGVTASAALAAVGSLTDSARAAVPAALRDATVRAAAEIASGRTIAAAASAPGRGVGRGRFASPRLRSTQDDCGRAALAGHARDRAGSGHARRSSTAAGRAHDPARLARGAPSRDAPAQGDVVQHADAGIDHQRRPPAAEGGTR